MMSSSSSSSSAGLPNRARVGLLLQILLALLLLFPVTAGLVQRRKDLGSRPPLCVNRCLSCRPCMARLVVSPRRDKGFKELAHEVDDTYYLLSWKCACGNKLFQP